MMLFNLYVLGLAVCGTSVFAKEMPVDAALAESLYDNGSRHMEIMAKKEKTWRKQRTAGNFKSENYESLSAALAVTYPVKCVSGKATAVAGDALNTFRCKNIDLYDFLTHAQLGSNGGEGSSSWGWTDTASKREFIAIGQSDGASFAEILPTGKLSYLGRLPQYSTASIWREIRGYKNYVIIGSEAVRHNVQVFDMTKLLTVNPASPKTFSNSADLTGLFTGLPNGRSHTITVNEELNYAVANGAQPRSSTCAGGLIFIDLTNPAKPTSPGCASQDGYVHDSQCLVYRGPDTAYVGKDICYGYNEDSLTIYDVTDKTAPKVISKTSYTGVAYAHQGWVLDKQNQTFLLLDDEYDEYDKTAPAADGHPVTYIWDIRSLAKPKQTGYYKSATSYSIDHNQYVKDGYSYQSNYGAGLRVLDVRSIPNDPTGKGVTEVAFFDVYPEDDAKTNGGVIDFVGSWSSYAFFPSGYIFVNTIERGGFVVKRTDI